MKRSMVALLLVVSMVVGLGASGNAGAEQSTNMTLLPSLLRVGSGTAYDSAIVQSPNWKGAIVCVAVTAEAGTATLDVKLQGKDNISGQFFDIPEASMTQITGITGDACLTVYPGVEEDANVNISTALPRIWKAVATVGTGASSSFTFSIGTSLIP